MCIVQNHLISDFAFLGTVESNYYPSKIDKLQYLALQLLGKSDTFKGLLAKHVKQYWT